MNHEVEMATLKLYAKRWEEQLDKLNEDPVSVEQVVGGMSRLIQLVEEVNFNDDVIRCPECFNDEFYIRQSCTLPTKQESDSMELVPMKEEVEVTTGPICCACDHEMTDAELDGIGGTVSWD